MERFGTSSTPGSPSCSNNGDSLSPKDDPHTLGENGGKAIKEIKEFVDRKNSDDINYLKLSGVAAEVKLLLKLIHEHNASARETDGRRSQRLTTMLTILDNIHSRVQKSQSSMPKRKAELRRCATELHRNTTTTTINNKEDKDKKPPSAGPEERTTLLRQLSANTTARRGLEKMFYSLGKEKEMIAGELSRRVNEVRCMEEMVSDLRAQNEKLLEKVRVCAAEHKGKEIVSSTKGPSCDVVALQERNRELTEQLMRSLEGYRGAKRRLKDVIEERERINARIAEVAIEAAAGVEKVRRLRERFGGQGIDEELGFLERVFAGFYRRLLMAAVPRGSPRESPVRGSPARGRGSPLDPRAGEQMMIQDAERG